MQGIDMVGDMRSAPDGSQPHPSGEVTAEFKYNWEVPLAGSGLKSTFNHELIGLDYIFCWTFHFSRRPSCLDRAATLPRTSQQRQRQQQGSSAQCDRIIDNEGCTGRICTSYSDHQGKNVSIPEKLMGSAFLIDDIQDSNGQELTPHKERMSHRFIRVVSVKALMEATFNQPPDASIDWEPSRPSQGPSQSASASPSSTSQNHSVTASCLPSPKQHPLLPMFSHQAASHHRRPYQHGSFSNQHASVSSRRQARSILSRATALHHPFMPSVLL